MSYPTGKRHSRRMKCIAVMLLVVFTGQLVAPNAALALTTGPSQPEVQGFEPVGTTDMVDMFSGSFVYNVPLMDVEGYPVNISYHGGVTMEQEASWVGLGWNINPGTINRTVRGVPDDFNGDSVFKDFNIKPERTFRVGESAGIEFAGIGDPGHIPGDNSPLVLKANFGWNFNFSNYRGISFDYNIGAGINVMRSASAGVNIGVGSQSGASFDYNLDLSMKSSNEVSEDMCYRVGVGVGGGYSTRSGLKDLTLSFTASAKEKEGNKETDGAAVASYAKIPIGVQNYVPVITNSSTMLSISGRLKMGFELFAAYGYGNLSCMFSTLEFKNDASRSAYGYMYLQNARTDHSSILDFTRDKDGMFNKSMRFLPVPHMTYDIYSLSGQGTGGTFRQFRNDFGNVYDPHTTSAASSHSGAAEVGLGETFESGWDYTETGTTISSGPWMDYQRSGMNNGFTSSSIGKLYENLYFKQGGELTSVNPDYFSLIKGSDILKPDDFKSLPDRKPGSDTARDVRANLIQYHTAEEDTMSGVGTNTHILSYRPYSSDFALPSYTQINRIGRGNFQKKKDQISEIVQIQKDGRKYVYGIPAMNNVQREVTFSVDPNNTAENFTNMGDGIVHFVSRDASSSNRKGKDNYYSSSITPSYTHSYLLTSVQSSDYVDLTGDGPSDDDLGSFTKFNYTRTDSDYRWISPYSHNFDSAQYNPGFWSDPRDDKGSVICGSREQWNLHSIETKNYIAEFYTSPREDAQGITQSLGITSLGLHPGQADPFNSSKTTPSETYKLDSIKLYNKHDRFINRSAAIPVKTVYFVYDYSLCPGIPNTTSPGDGKLTLKKIYFSYGTSKKSMMSPYVFGYSSFNPAYNLCSKDRWGSYKPNNHTFTNYEFPYVDQSDPNNDTYASAWSLNSITLPSGGVIQANYESNDYSFVQDKPVTEMCMVKGVGNSPDYINDSRLYADKNSPFLYAYFLRRRSKELSGLSFGQNYLGRDYQANTKNVVYFNFNVQLAQKTNTYEQIKGYVNVTETGVCSNDPNYGYIKLNPVTPTGGGANLNPITYTVLNVGRFNLPNVVYPGSDPDESDIMNIIKGFIAASKELLDIGQSPIVSFVNKGDGRNINLDKSFFRLYSPGLSKKGGGQRVKSLTFDDQWHNLVGGNDSNATYGKQYDYTIADPYYGKISSGVASYEPIVGGDENPMRQPIPYIGQSGSNFPPNDPVELYQETPIGETLFPSGQVGYSSVMVSSIHADKGKSAQGVDLYQFYTAKDFPAQTVASTMDANSTNHYDFFTQNNTLTAKQSYTLIFNDMHGKPKMVEHEIYNPASQTLQPISYQQFNYRQTGTHLNNTVKCLVYNGTGMVVQERQLGVETDVTMDTRDKDEQTSNISVNGNFNAFIIPLIVPIPVILPFAFTWSNSEENQFRSVAVSKVIQQYGILDNIQSFNEGAKTSLQNEIYDATTGQAVVTSINNEFNDREYTTNIPAYWVYKGMGPSYKNIGYKDTGTITIDSSHLGTLNISNVGPLVVGDQLSVSFTDAMNTRQHTTAWVLGPLPGRRLDTFLTEVESSSTHHFGPDTFVGSNYSHVWIYYYSTYVPVCSGLKILPRFPLNTLGWNMGDTLTNVKIEVISSGQKNMLTDNIESYTAMDHPVNSVTGALNTYLTGLISLNAKTYSDSNTMTIHRYLADADSVNPFAIGQRGLWRPYTEYVYKTDRTYAGTTSRNSGLFNGSSMLAAPVSLPGSCYMSPYNYFMPGFSDQNWHISHTATKYSPYGREVENRDAVGNYSTAVFGYNQQLPVAVAGNAKQGDVFSEGFEDYNLLHYTDNIMEYKYSFFDHFDSGVLSNPFYDTLRIHHPSDSLSIVHYVAHTGLRSVYLPSVGGATTYSGLSIPVNVNNYAGIYNHYNSYFPCALADTYRFSSANEYLPFGFVPGKKYVVSYWILKPGVPTTQTDYVLPDSCGVLFTGGGVTFYGTAVKKRTNIIDGWMQVEATFTVPLLSAAANIVFPANYYMDDIRIYPADANMKAFVYHPYSEKLMATLDENNFATMYEYDQEGNLVRVKKETTRGIMTISESRSGNPIH